MDLVVGCLSLLGSIFVSKVGKMPGTPNNQFCKWMEMVKLETSIFIYIYDLENHSIDSQPFI